MGVIGRHVECPHEFLDTEAGRVDRHDEAGDAVALPGLPEVRAKMKSWVAVAPFQYFSPLITHSSPSCNGGGLHPCGVERAAAR